MAWYTTRCTTISGLVWQLLRNEQDDENPLKSDGSLRPMRIVKPVTLAATLNFAASLAQASRLFEDYDATYASTLLTEAKESYQGSSR